MSQPSVAKSPGSGSYTTALNCAKRSFSTTFLLGARRDIESKRRCRRLRERAEPRGAPHSAARPPLKTALVRNASGRQSAAVVAAEAHQHEARALRAQIRSDKGASAARLDPLRLEGTRRCLRPDHRTRVIEARRDHAVNVFDVQRLHAHGHVARKQTNWVL